MSNKTIDVVSSIKQVKQGSNDPFFMSENNLISSLYETSMKLKQIKKLLKGLDLLNNKYLMTVNGNYYFVLKVGNKVIRKSLFTDNHIYANILKLKIMNRVRNMTDFDRMFQSTFTKIRSGSNITLIAENETERKLLDNMEKTIDNTTKKYSREYKEVVASGDTTRDVINLKVCCTEYLEERKNLGIKEKILIKDRQAIDYLFVFFGEKKLIKDINSRDASSFRSFLFQVPKFYKQKKDLKDKNIKLLIDKKSKLLDKYDKQMKSTVLEVVKRVKSMFSYFENDMLYIIKNPFAKLTVIKQDRSSKREFNPSEIKSVFSHMKKNKLTEEYNFLKFALYSGLRRGEILDITKEQINFNKCYIEVFGTKTENSKRILVIHKDLKSLICSQLEGKNDKDKLFFNVNLDSKYRHDAIGVDINSIIKDVVGEEAKKYIDIPSLRKNFTQEVFLSDLFTELNYKTMVGHSTKSDVTDAHYIRGKRDYKMLKEKIDKVDFSEFFPEESIFKYNEDDEIEESY